MKLLLLASFLISFHSFGSSSLKDVLNGTELKYGLRSLKFEKSVWADERIYCLAFDDENHWKGAKKLEENLKAWASQLILDSNLRDRAIASMRKDLHFLYEQKAIQNGDLYDGSMSDYINKLIPEEIYFKMNPFALNGHVLVLNLKVLAIERDRPGQYSQSLVYDELYYFDLNDGKKLDPANFFDPSKQNQLLKKVKKGIPKKVLERLGTTDLLLAKPLFYGASFYFIITGSVNASSKTSFNYHVRLSLEEIKPFLKNGGALKVYLKLEEELPENPTKLRVVTDEDGSWYEKDFLVLLDEHYLIEEAVNPGVKSVSYYRQKKQGDHLIEYAEYDASGRITMKVRYDTNDLETEDSTLYFYRSNGKLMRLDYYEIGYDDDTTYLNYSDLYNERGDLEQCVYYDDDWSHYFSYEYKEFTVVHYFKDRVILDGFVESPLGTGIALDWHEVYDLWGGFEIERKPSELIEVIKPVNRNGNRIHEERVYNKRDTLIIDLSLHDNRVVRGDMFNTRKWNFTVEYDKNGKPISYTKIRYQTEDATRTTTYSVDRDEFGKPVSYEIRTISPTEDRTRTYKIVYK